MTNKSRRLTADQNVGRIVRKVQSSTNSWQTFNDIHYWLSQCTYTHGKCGARLKAELNEPPTRLLYVGAFEADSKVYLRPSGQLSNRNTTYATLSHCWGSYMSIKLQTTNADEFSEGIAITALPQTFRDAVGLVKALGIDYLWIDSLCIIQDSEEDWAMECARMSQVYAGSFVNIAANASGESHGGLFRTRSWKSVSPLTLEVTYAPVGWQNRPVVLYPNGEGVLEHAPLAKRAWVTQERILAPRTIHFCQHKVVWECAEHFASESDVTGRVERPTAPPVVSNLAVRSTTYNTTDTLGRPYALPLLWPAVNQSDAEPSQEVVHPVLISLHTPAISRDQPADERGIFLSKWSAVVSLYSRGQLSIPTDKLIAISGIAQYMHENLWTGDELRYYAGLWSYHFEFQLTWSAHRPSRGARADRYIAPSWSWASLDGEVSFPKFYDHNRREYLARLTHIRLTPVRGVFGALQSGFIRVRGPLCRVALADTSRQEGSLDNRRSLILLGSGVEIRFKDLMFDHYEDLRVTSRELSDKACLVLLGIVKEGPSEDGLLNGIILRLTQRHPPHRGEYRRIGSFTFDDPNSWENNELSQALGVEADSSLRDNYDSLMASFAAMNLPDAFYHGRFGSSYEITII